MSPSKNKMVFIKTALDLLRASTQNHSFGGKKKKKKDKMCHFLEESEVELSVICF